MVRQGIAALPLVALVAILAMPGCGGDPPAGRPPVSNLGDLSLTLELSATSLAVADTATATVVVHGDSAGVLEEFAYSWRWSGMTRYGTRILGMTRALVQPSAPGRLTVEVLVEDGVESVHLTAEAQVPATGSDGSRDMLTVYEGAFLRGERSDQTTFSSNTPQRTIALSRFSLARTEMTNAGCAEILNRAADEGLVTSLADPGWLVWSPGPPSLDSYLAVLDLGESQLTWDGQDVSVPAGYELHPVTGVTWPGAAALCNWVSAMDDLEPAYTFTPTESIHRYDITCDFFANGYRLPTEAEWEKAARGALVLSTGANPLPDRRYPWGDDDPRLSLAHGVPGSVRANVSARMAISLKPSGRIFSGSLPVGSFPLGAGPYGHLDLLGNAAEWCYDWVDLGYYAGSPDVDPIGVADVHPTVDDWKALRGDSWLQAYIPAMAASTSEEGCGKRRWAAYTYRSSDLGFRLARSER